MRVFVLSVLVALSCLGASPGGAQTSQSAKGAAPDTTPAFDRESERQQANKNLLVLMGGGLGGPYLKLAHDISVAVNDGDNMRVLPVSSSGAFSNVRDILLLRGVDLGITTVQILNKLKASDEFGPNIERRIAYIAALSVDTFHVLARPGINSLKDLDGKKASFNTKGSGTFRFGPGNLKALGVTVEATAMPQGDALQAMRDGKLAATLCQCPSPVPPYLGLKGSGFKFLEMPYIPAFEQDYVPASITNAHYPNLVAPGTKVKTIATSTILVTYNWPPGTKRYRKVEKFVNALFSNLDKLRQPPRHPAWRSVNIGATIRGWTRFPAAQQWLDRQAARARSAQSKGIDLRQARKQAARVAPHDPAEQERLFKEFLEWTRKQSRR